MMYYKIYASESGAKRASRKEAVERGCTGTTQYWYGWIVHKDGRAALRSQEQVDSTWVSELDESWFPELELQ